MTDETMAFKSTFKLGVNVSSTYRELTQLEGQRSGLWGQVKHTQVANGMPQ